LEEVMKVGELPILMFYFWCLRTLAPAFGQELPNPDLNRTNVLPILQIVSSFYFVDSSGFSSQ
jgi:hypothetical protein